MNNYIPLPSNMRNREEILRLRMRENEAGYGVYVMILEMMREEKNYRIKDDVEGISWAIHATDIDLVRRVINDYGLFIHNEDGTIHSPWLIEAMEPLETRRTAAQEKAKAAAAARWAAAQSAENVKNAQAMHEQCTSNAHASVNDASSIEKNANIYNINKINKPTNQKKGSWTVAEGLTFPAEYIDGICRCSDNEIDNTMKQWAQSKSDKEHNMAMIVDIAQFFGLNRSQCSLLIQITQNGLVGGRETKELIKTYNKCRADNYKARFPMNYILANMSGWKEANNG